MDPPRPGARVPALAIDATQHSVRQLAGADTVPDLRQLDGLRDRGIRWHAVHELQLIDANAQQVGEVGVQARDPATNAGWSAASRILASPKEAVDQLLRPATVSRIEAGRASIECCIEQHALPQVGEHVSRGYARIGDAGVRSRDDDHWLKIDGRWEMGDGR